MANIFREVDEDIRKERYINLLKKYGLYVAFIIIFIVAALSSIQIYNSYIVSSNEKNFENYISIVESFPEDAIEQLAALDKSNNFLNGMSLLKQSDILILNDEIGKATSLLENIFDNKSLSNIHREIAIYKILMINFDELKNDEFLYYQDKVTKNKDVYFLIEELHALKMALNDEISDAITKLNNLSTNINVPQEIKSRSLVFLKIIE